MVVELKEDQIEEFIKEGKSVIKVFTDLDKCNPCKQYAPIFDSVARTTDGMKFGQIWVSHPKDPKPTPSAFRRSYMKNDKGAEHNSVPATMIFENGKLTATMWGTTMDAEFDEKRLRHFLSTKEILEKKKSIEDVIKSSSNVQLESFAYRAIMNIENLKRELDLIQEALSKRQQPQKAQ